MPVRKEILEKNKPYHIYNAWYNNTSIFRAVSDFDRFINIVNKYLNEYKWVKIMSYSILADHFHFILESKINSEHISKFMWKIQQAYSMYYKLKYKKLIPGLVWIPLFKGRFQVKEIIWNDNLLKIQAYVNLNPLKHNYVNKILDYPYCSYNQTIWRESKWSFIKISNFTENIYDFYDENICEFD